MLHPVAGLAILAALTYPDALVDAADLSEDALAVARANVAGCGATRVRVAEGTWFDALPAEARGALRLIVSNPPYIAAHEVGDLPAAVIGLFQAVILYCVVRFALGMQVEHPVAMLAFMVLVSCTFVAARPARVTRSAAIDQPATPSPCSAASISSRGAPASTTATSAGWSVASRMPRFPRSPKWRRPSASPCRCR